MHCTVLFLILLIGCHPSEDFGFWLTALTILAVGSQCIMIQSESMFY